MFRGNFKLQMYIFKKKKDAKPIAVIEVVKNVSSPSPIDTAKLQLFTEQLLMRKTRRLADKVFYN